MKKLSCMLFTILALVGLASCGQKEPMVNGQWARTDHSTAVRYDQFTGEEEISFHLDEERDVLVEIETIEGQLNLVLVNTEDTDRAEPYLYESNIQTTQLEGTLTAGDYTLYVEGVNHKGGFGIEY